jgi:two-component system, sensor histidine kinase PdtaS
VRTIPLMPGGSQVGTLVLLRDVTELRRRERALLSKDATIREIHHRVKNNLQTVAALLRLQARRLDLPEARVALEEAVRRVRAIALVHDTLSQTLDGPVDFDEVADRLITMVGEVSAAESGSLPRRAGSFGQLPAALATPLSMVLTELLQNALEHGLRGRSGVVEVSTRRLESELEIVVADDGEGLPVGFSLSASPRLGLQIVRTLVEGDLRGQLEIVPRPGGGTLATLRIPVPTADAP